MFDDGWLVPGYPPEFGGRNAGLYEQAVCWEELGRRRVTQSFNPAGARHRQRVDHHLRHRRAEAHLGGADHAGGEDGGAGHERAGRGQRPGRGCPPGPSLTGDRFIVKRPRKSGPPAPTTPTCCWRSCAPTPDVPQAQGHLGVDHRDRHARPGAAALRRHHRTAARLQRGVLRRCGGAPGQSGGRAERRLAGVHRLAGPRAGDGCGSCGRRGWIACSTTSSSSSQAGRGRARPTTRWCSTGSEAPIMDSWALRLLGHRQLARSQRGLHVAGPVAAEAAGLGGPAEAGAF